MVFPFRLALATLYVQLGNMDDALALLEAEPNLSESERVGGTVEEGPGGGEESTVSVPKEQVNYFRVRTDLNDNFNNCLQDIRLLLHKYTLLVNKGRLREYVGVGEELLAFLFREVHHRSDVKGTQLSSCPVCLHVLYLQREIRSRFLLLQFSCL